MAVAEPAALPARGGRQYLAAFAQAWEAARRVTGELTHVLSLGPETGVLRFAGSALAEVIIPALAPVTRARARAEPAWTIELWDGASTGVRPPPFPWRGGDVGARGVVSKYEDAGIRVVVQARDAAGEVVSVTMLDEPARVARVFVTAPELVPWYERAAPLRTAFDWFLRGSHQLLVHAAAVGLGDRGVLLAGSGGSGKSMTALACALAGMQYVGDDYVLLDVAGEEPVARALYSTAKLAPAAAALIPELERGVMGWSRRESDKYVVALEEVAPGKIRREQRVSAIVLPRLVPGEATAVASASGFDALLALAPSTIFQTPGNGRALRILADLVRRLPAFHLRIGGSPAEAADAIQELARRIRSA